MARVSLGAAADSPATRDPVIASLLAQAGPPQLPRPRGWHFEALLCGIVYQQLAGAAVLTWSCWKAADLYGQTRVDERGRAPIPPDMVGG
jgi:hypothetical protein